MKRKTTTLSYVECVRMDMCHESRVDAHGCFMSVVALIFCSRKTWPQSYTSPYRRSLHHYKLYIKATVMTSLHEKQVRSIGRVYVYVGLV